MIFFNFQKSFVLKGNSGLSRKNISELKIEPVQAHILDGSFSRRFFLLSRYISSFGAILSVSKFVK
ncbi:unnamed protein product [Laminaria digitata]